MKPLQNLAPERHPTQRAEHIVFPFAVDCCLVVQTLARIGFLLGPCVRCGVSRTAAKASRPDSPASLLDAIWHSMGLYE
jgi:hypothetical protein